MASVHETGGRGSGRPKDTIKYGKRTGMLVNTYRDPQEAHHKARILEEQGIMAVTRPWYSKWCVYKLGQRTRRVRRTSRRK